jgi:hypothetical protein
MMKKRIILVVACLMMLLSGSCLAANWVWVTSDSRMGFFFDSDSIKVYETEGKPETRRITFWEQIVYDDAFAEKQGVINGQTVKAIRQRVNCSRPNMAQVTYSRYFYAKDGTVLASKPNMQEKEPLIPDTFGDKVSLAVEKYAIEHNIKPQK